MSVHEQVARKGACESCADTCGNCVEVSARAFMLFCEETDRQCMSVKLGKLGDKSDGSLRKTLARASNNRCPDRGITKCVSEKNVQGPNLPSHCWICFWTTMSKGPASHTRDKEASWICFCTASSRGALNEGSVSSDSKKTLSGKNKRHATI